MLGLCTRKMNPDGSVTQLSERDQDELKALIGDMAQVAHALTRRLPQGYSPFSCFECSGMSIRTRRGCLFAPFCSTVSGRASSDARCGQDDNSRVVHPQSCKPKNFIPRSFRRPREGSISPLHPPTPVYLSQQSLRTLCFAYADLAPGHAPPGPETDIPENDLVCLAIVGIKDPCRPGVPDAVARCQVRSCVDLLAVVALC